MAKKRRGWGGLSEGPRMLCFMHPSPTETWHQTTQGGGRERMKAKGGRRRSLGSSCSQCQACWPPQHGAGVLSARQAWGRANWERLGPEACGGEGARKGSMPGFPSHRRGSLLPGNPRKRPFSVEVNDPAQINGSVGVPSHHRETPTCSS